MVKPDLPQDILAEIFLILPTKSVGRLRILSKYWQAHLSTTNFIKKHLITRQQTKENVVLTMRRGELNIITSPTKNEEVSNSKYISHEWIGVAGSCHGLILLWGFGKLLLVNPLTLKHLSIQPYIPCMKSCYLVSYGFGYDCCTDDYKVVQLSCFSSNNENQIDVVDVYSVNKRVWNRVYGNPSIAHLPSGFGLGNPSLANGALHWLICSGLYSSCITAFDLTNEVFHEIPMPNGFVKEHENFVEGSSRLRTSCWLSNVGCCLTIIDNYYDGVTDFWILKEYGVAESWVRFQSCLDIETVWVGGVLGSVGGTLCFLKDEELLSLTNEGNLVVCDLRGGASKKVILSGCNGRFSHGISFIDSLVSP